MARGSSRVVMTSRIGRRGAMAHAKTSANNLIKAFRRHGASGLVSPLHLFREPQTVVLFGPVFSPIASNAPTKPMARSIGRASA
jgi:hypothetical protein